MPPGDAVISDEMQQSIGSVLRECSSLPVTEGDIRMWAEAVYYPELPPEQFVLGTGSPGPVTAPEDFNPFRGMIATPYGWAPRLGEYDQWVEGALGIESPPSAGVALNGEVHTTYSEVGIEPGDVVHSVERLAGYRVAPTGKGYDLLLTTTASDWSNQRGDHLKHHEWTVVRFVGEIDQRARPPSPEARRVPGDELPPWARPASLEVWNRFAVANNELYEIHFDHEVARSRGLPGPIGMGNQLVAYVHAASRTWCPGRSVREVRARFVRPWQLGGEVVVHGVLVGEGGEGGPVDVEVWADDAVGSTLCRARVRLR